MKNHALRLAMALVPTLALAFSACGRGDKAPGPDLTITGVTIDPSDVPDLVVGETMTLTTAVQPDAAPDKTVRWSSSRPDVASVEATHAASATITALLTLQNSVLLVANVYLPLWLLARATWEHRKWSDSKMTAGPFVFADIRASAGTFPWLDLETTLR